MKRMLYIFAFLLLFSMQMKIESKAMQKQEISNAISIIRNKTKITKNIKSESSLKFDKSDFDDIFGEIDYDFISISSLPQAKKGTLRLNGIRIENNQSIPIGSIASMDFICPEANTKCNFEFKIPDSDHKYCFEIICTETDNELECFENNFETYKNIALYDKLHFAGNNANIEIVSPPEKGIIELTSKKDGEFIYRPMKNYSGNDSFSYRIIDEYGNKSNISHAKIDIEKANKNIYFKDLENKECHKYAIKAVESGMMTYYYDKNNFPIFNPETSISDSDLINCIKLFDEKAVSSDMGNQAKIKVSDCRIIIENLIKLHPELLDENAKEKLNSILSDENIQNKEITREDLAMMLGILSDHLPS